jgi:hypothetical protein
MTENYEQKIHLVPQSKNSLRDQRIFLSNRGETIPAIFLPFLKKCGFFKLVLQSLLYADL